MRPTSIRPHSRQPQYASQINWGHPLANKLALATLGSVPGFNLCENREATAYNGAERVAGPGGIGLTWASTASPGIQLNSATPLVGANGDYTRGLTVAVLADPAASSTRYIPWALSKAAAAQPEIYLLFNANKAITATSGTFAVATQGANGANFASAVDGNLHWFVAVFPDGSSTPAGSEALPALYVDGVDGTASSTGAANITSAYADNTKMDYIGGYSANGYACTGFGLYAVLGWNTALDVETIGRYLVAGNPEVWGVFAPQLRPYALGTAAAPGGIVGPLIGGRLMRGGALIGGRLAA